MAKELTRTVHVTDPRTRQFRTFGPGDDVPGWAAKQITNESAWVDEDAKKSALERSDNRDLRDAYEDGVDTGRSDAISELFDRAEVEDEEQLLAVIDAGKVALADENEGTGQGGGDTPAKSAAKPEWVAYAVSQGMSEEDANKATQPELVAKFHPES